jgi:riboflavin synthase
MFTGIITHVAKIDHLTTEKITIPNILDQVCIGDSIAINGVCLTVEKILQNKLQFHCGPITKKTTNLGSSSFVNIEQALRLGDSVGGHFVTGHIDAQLRFLYQIKSYDGVLLHFPCPPESHLIIPKGSIAINGVSLTVSHISLDAFAVQVIPHTMQHTNLYRLKPGDLVNVEYDIFAKYGKVDYEHSRN